MRVAILGSASSSLDSAPWMARDIERWAGASFYKYHEKLAGFVNRWFEIHPDIEQLRSGWLGWAIEKQCVCELQEPHPELKHSSAYPIEATTARFGPYFTSTISYMIAAAIHAEAEEISLYGVNMSGDIQTLPEYVHQKSCCEYLIGFARGMGITFNVAEGSPLLKSSNGLYGYEYIDTAYEGFSRISA